MADKTLTVFEPGSNDVIRISFEYAAGICTGVNVYYTVRSNDLAVPTVTTIIFVPLASLAAGVQGQIANLLTEAVRLARSKFATG